jgi:putative ABC transport system permease protein
MTLWPLSSRARRERDLDDELQAHFAMAVRDRIERGEAPLEAEQAARREFGNRTLVREVTRETWGWGWLEALWYDVRYALRAMAKSPGFTAVAVLSLALGIGANTAIFSLVHTLILRSLPVREPERLVELLTKYPGEPRWSGFNWKAYELFRDHNHVFSGLIAASQPWDSQLSLRGEGIEPETVHGEYVSGNFFPTLGVKPALGRLPGPDNDQPGADAATVAVLSWPFWNRRFQLDPAIVGKRIVLDDVTVTIIGVAPREFFGLQVGMAPDLWVPAAIEAAMHRPSRVASGRIGMRLVGRLRPGVSLQQARAEMEVLDRSRIEELAKTDKNSQLRQMKMEVEPAGAGLSRPRDQFAKPLLALQVVVVLLMLLACANVAGMLLARGAARERELALRVSLGAGRFRLVRQALTESLLLAAAGSLLGLVIAHFGAAALVGIMASAREKMDLHVQLDGTVLLFTGGAALLTGVLFGLVPAWRAWVTAPLTALREAGRGGETRWRRACGRSLVAAQVALSFILLSAASLFVQQLSALRYLDLGFERDSVLLVGLDPARGGYKRDQLAGPYQELLGRLAAIPGVRCASVSGVTPVSGAGASLMIAAEGFQEDPARRRYVSMNRVAPKYFATLGTPLLAGRDFTVEDRNRPRVAIVNQRLARYYFGGGNPIGKHVTVDGESKPYEIVGVVGDAKYLELRETPARTIYFNAFQERYMPSQFSLRTRVAPEAVVSDVRRTVREVLKTVPVQKVSTLAAQVDASIAPERLVATLSGFFGALGAVLAAIGLYGLLAFTVARRVNEIGIRMALGASRGDVVRMVLREAVAVVCAGIAVALPLALWGRRFAASLIRDVPAGSAAPLAFAVAALLAVALLAAYVPANGAARVDPMEALRRE